MLKPLHSVLDFPAEVENHTESENHMVYILKAHVINEEGLAKG